MKPTLQLKLSTGLILTPQLKQSIELLQLSTLELNQEISRVLQENPLLEREEIVTNQEEVLSSIETNAHQEDEEHVEMLSDWPDDNLYTDQESFFSYHSSDEEYDYTSLISKPTSLREHLLMQISTRQCSDQEKKMAELLIDSLDDDGYFTQDIQELAELLPSELNISTTDLESTLLLIQQLDPLGIGARNLQECLTIQLAALPDSTPLRAEALRLISDHLESVATKNFALLKKIINCDDDQLQSIYQLITQLNPKPGDAFNATTARYVIPDIIISKINDEWVVQLNPDAVPRIRVNHLYADILKQNHSDTSQLLKEQLKEARWFIRNIGQRMLTILRVSQAIIEHQQAFLEEGEIAIRPLVMREIAETLKLHESTISRVTTQKYMRTPHGIFELKYFFGSHIPNQDGEAQSAIAIRSLIKQLIQNEDRKKPLSDSSISKMLAQQDIVIARRTVAKYRELMHIPPTNLRKTL